MDYMITGEHMAFLEAHGFRKIAFDDMLLCPWEVTGNEFRRLHSLVTVETPVQIYHFYNIYLLARQAMRAKGVFVECGVFKGGTASFIANVLADRRPFHLFDTFEGLPALSKNDHVHFEGEFSRTDVDTVIDSVGHRDTVIAHKGLIPDTFAGFDNSIAFAHVDVDLYQSVKDCCEFLYPRMSVGGIMLFDDYGHFTCPGAHKAVNEYFADKNDVPLPLFFGQCVVIKGAE